MTNRHTRDQHEQAAYEAAIRARERKLVGEELERYKKNIQALMPVDDPNRPGDFPGTVE